MVLWACLLAVDCSWVVHWPCVLAQNLPVTLCMQLQPGIRCMLTHASVHRLCQGWAATGSRAGLRGVCISTSQRWRHHQADSLVGSWLLAQGCKAGCSAWRTTLHSNEKGRVQSAQLITLHECPVINIC